MKHVHIHYAVVELLLLLLEEVVAAAAAAVVVVVLVVVFRLPFALRTISATVKCLRLLSGRQASMRTISPKSHSWFSSCAK